MTERGSFDETAEKERGTKIKGESRGPGYFGVKPSEELKGGGGHSSRVLLSRKGGEGGKGIR